MKHQASPQVGISGIYAGEDVKFVTAKKGDGYGARQPARSVLVCGGFSGVERMLVLLQLRWRFAQFLERIEHPFGVFLAHLP